MKDEFAPACVVTVCIRYQCRYYNDNEDTNIMGMELTPASDASDKNNQGSDVSQLLLEGLIPKCEKVDTNKLADKAVESILSQKEIGQAAFDQIRHSANYDNEIIGKINERLQKAGSPLKVEVRHSTEPRYYTADGNYGNHQTFVALVDTSKKDDDGRFSRFGFDRGVEKTWMLESFDGGYKLTGQAVGGTHYYDYSGKSRFVPLKDKFDIDDLIIKPGK